MSYLVVVRNCCLRSRVGVGMNRSAREGKSVKRFERSDGLDTVLYKNYLYPFFTIIRQYGIYRSRFQESK